MITVSLELAKKMQEAGWEKTTWFSEEFCPKCNEEILPDLYNTYECHDCDFIVDVYGSGNCKKLFYPTAQEIIDELSDSIKEKRTKEIGYLEIKKHKGIYTLSYCYYEIYHSEKIIIYHIENKLLADAAGELRIRCKNNGHID